IANGRVFQVLVDNGSSADILFASACQIMNISGAMPRPTDSPLYEFTKECAHREGVIGLPIAFGEEPAATTKIMNFFIVDQKLAYNAIISRLTLNKL
ncbi:hypothetical protein PanWU01x14_305120, partial [Parasponia andersonii]